MRKDLATPPAVMSTESLRDAVESLQDLVTAARAKRTIPRQRCGDRLQRAARVREAPSVDPKLWFVHERYARYRRPEDLEFLVQEYDQFARSLARRYYREHEALEDLQQVALEALVVALDRFDPARGLPFVAFAKPTITGALKRHFRDHGWAIRVPRQVHALAGPIADATRWLEADLGRSPTAGQIADLLGIDKSVVDDVLKATEARRVEPIDTESPAFAGHDEDLALAELRRALDQCKQTLSAPDRRILDWYFEEECTQAEIAERLDCSQMQVSRQLRRILAELRELLT